MLIGNNNEEKIWNYLISNGLTSAGVAGLMGNLYAESGLSSNNLQNTGNKALNLTDEEYTDAVNKGIYGNFIHDKYGYGLCQWTYYTRKEALLRFMQNRKVSIGDLESQLDFLMTELNSRQFVAILDVLKSTDNVKTASNTVLLQFERPLDMSEAVQNKRYSYAQGYYDKYVKKGESEMAYTNSPLVTYKRLSPNRTSPRNHAIDTITIHCYVAQVTAKQGCDYFASDAAKRAQVSSNYVVGKDGSIGLSVEEKNRSWCSSNAKNDHRAITIEVASDTKTPFAVTDAAYNALIELVADICKRNGIKKLVWSNNKDDRINHRNGCNMTVHQDFANKSCPGPYLYARQGAIAAAVNKKLGIKSSGDNTTPSAPVTPSNSGSVLYRVRKSWEDANSQIGAFSKLENAKPLVDKNPEYKVFDDKGNVVYMITPKIKEYKVKVNTTYLYIRKGPGKNYATNGVIKDAGIYTITEESDGTGASKWGKLKSGAGWISLDFCKKI